MPYQAVTPCHRLPAILTPAAATPPQTGPPGAARLRPCRTCSPRSSPSPPPRARRPTGRWPTGCGRLGWPGWSDRSTSCAPRRRWRGCWSGGALVLTKLTTGASLVPFHQWTSGITALACVLVVGWSIAQRRAAPDGAHAALLVLVVTDVVNALVHASHLFDAWWSELLVADTAAVAIVLLGYLAVLGKEAAQRWRQAS